jgi:hypothetical protein
VGGVCRRSACLVLFFSSFFVARMSAAKSGAFSEACTIAPGYRFAHPGYVLAPRVIEPKPVLPPVLKLRRDAILRGVFLARAVPQASDALHRENEIACLFPPPR